MAKPGKTGRKAQTNRAARRARAEAKARRAAAVAAPQPSEHEGREGPDPARYGDWEKNGIARDF
ncbi:MAG TPA: DUF1674 domain-containing protein [Devosiaceae bacterium]|nr:DUF1674 domain-containing protein [Devosiaceae bacterium]